MLNDSRMNIQNSADTMTIFVSLSLVYFTCMKKRTTMAALMLAIKSAIAVLNGPKSTVAIQAVKPVRQIRTVQIVQYSLLGTMCSDMAAHLFRSIRYSNGNK